MMLPKVRARRFSCSTWCGFMICAMLVVSVDAHAQNTERDSTKDTTTAAEPVANQAVIPVPEDQSRTIEADAAAPADTPTIEEPVTDEAAKQAVRLLSDADPQRRQQGAETIARRASIEHRRLVTGYRLQERDARVRLALDWALYRIGKPDALFGVVNALSTDRRAQAVDYLARLEDPTTLVALLRSPKREIKTGVLEALGRAGDERTLRALEVYVASPDLSIASAAQLAITQIETRLAERALTPASPSRPRRTRQTIGNANPD